MSDHAIVDQGIVRRLDGDQAFVSMLENPACDDCGAKIICAPDSSGERGVMARNSSGAKVGQRVMVTESKELLLRISLMQYGLPLLGFLLGVFAVYFLDLSVIGIPVELLYFVGGLAGLGILSIFAHHWAKRISGDESMYFEIVKIYNGD